MRRRADPRELARVLFVLAGVVLVISVALLAIHAWERKNDAVTVTDEGEVPTRPVITFAGEAYRQKKELTNVLFIGVDKYQSEFTGADSFSNDQQCDFLLLLSFDAKAQTVQALQLNRDTMTEVPLLGVGGRSAGSVTEQLALAHTYGTGGADSCRNTVKAVRDLLGGVYIDHYVRISMDAVGILNDLVGGVTVNVTDDFSAAGIDIPMGEVTLTADQAMAFVRARGGMNEPTNLNRMERQKQYLHSFYSQYSEAIRSDAEFSPEALLSIGDYMLSDCTSYQLQELADRVKDYSFTDIETVKGEAVVGEEFMEFYPDTDALMSQVIGMMFNKK